jgi:hypothetical protein
MGTRTWVLACAGAAIASLAVPDHAHADPPEASDYESVVISVEPPTPTVAVDFVGGDSFVQLTVAPGTEVVVVGYQNEPFLRFLADGTVERNERSPSVYLSLDRMGTAAVPAYADATLPPLWRAIGTGGRYAWHDHRAHWMGPTPPPDNSPGDRLQTGVIPLVVAGAPVSVTVATDWLPDPSPVALYAGAGVAALGVAAALTRRRRVVWPLLAVSGLAAALGAWQYRSLPVETGPRLVWWLLPVVATASALVALVLGRRLVASALLILAGLELAIWVYVRRDSAWRPVLPTDAPFWLDRAVLAGAAVTAVVAVVGGAIGLFRPDA